MAVLAPDWLVPILAVGTQLGDIWLLSLVVGIAYLRGSIPGLWRGTRRQGCFLIGTLLVSICLVETLKPLFGKPRPPGSGVAPSLPWLPQWIEPLYQSMATGSGYAFPSGHAVGITMVVGAGLLGAVQPITTRRGLLAGGTVAFVGATRVLLGVHDVVDVLAGVVIGGSMVGLCWLGSNRGSRPERVGLLAVGIGTVGTLAHPDTQVALATGAAIGVTAGWQFVTQRQVLDPRKSSRVELAVAGVGGAIAISGLLFAGIWIPAALGAIGTAIVIASPAIGR